MIPINISELLDIHSLYYQNSTLYCRVSGGRLIAKFKNSPFNHIMERLDEVEGKLYLTLCGERIQIRQD